MTVGSNKIQRGETRGGPHLNLPLPPEKSPNISLKNVELAGKMNPPDDSEECKPMTQKISQKMIGQALDIAPSSEFAARLKQNKYHQKLFEAPSLLDGPEHVIIGGRQEGKTTLAVKWLMECPDGVERVLITLDNYSAESIKRDCGFPVRDPRVISYRTLLNGKARPGVEYGIDETVPILMNMLGLREMPRLVTVQHAEAWQGVGGPNA